MNANFATIKTKLDELDIGFTGSIATDLVVTCTGGGSTPTFPTDYSTIVMNADYNDGNFASNTYTIPSTGLYRFFLHAPNEDTMGQSSSVDLSTDSGVNWTSLILAYTAPVNGVQKFTAGDKIRVSSGCGTMAGADSTIDSAKFLFAIKKF
jgi:hypothetical protein